MGFFVLGFLWFQMRDALSRLLVLTALGMLFCGIAIDFGEGLDEDHEWNVYSRVGNIDWVEEWSGERFRRSGYTVVQHFAKSAEELVFEAGAFSIFWFLFLRHLLRGPEAGLRIPLRGRAPPAGQG